MNEDSHRSQYRSIVYEAECLGEVEGEREDAQRERRASSEEARAQLVVRARRGERPARDLVDVRRVLVEARRQPLRRDELPPRARASQPAAAARPRARLSLVEEVR